MTNSVQQKVLLIEDDKFLSELLVTNLRKENFDVILTIDAEGAWKELEKQPLPNIIILDLILPGTNGFEFLGQIKKEDRFKSIPVVILSNLGSEQDIKKGLALGANAYLVKAHILPEDLIKKIRETLLKVDIKK